MSSVIKVIGMSCQHCVRAVRTALEAVPGVTGVAVDLEGAMARIEGEAAQQDLIHAIREAGYQAEPLPPG